MKKSELGAIIYSTVPYTALRADFEKASAWEKEALMCQMFPLPLLARLSCRAFFSSQLKLPPVPDAGDQSAGRDRMSRRQRLSSSA